MKIYIICAVRNAEADTVAGIRGYAQSLRSLGHDVHFPPDDAPQDDPTGLEICKIHRAAMQACDEVHVFWDVSSWGSHFDIGMAFAMGKPVLPVDCTYPDVPRKSYWKVILGMRR